MAECKNRTKRKRKESYKEKKNAQVLAALEEQRRSDQSLRKEDFSNLSTQKDKNCIPGYRYDPTTNRFYKQSNNESTEVLVNEQSTTSKFNHPTLKWCISTNMDIKRSDMSVCLQKREREISRCPQDKLTSKNPSSKPRKIHQRIKREKTKTKQGLYCRSISRFILLSLRELGILTNSSIPLNSQETHNQNESISAGMSLNIETNPTQKIVHCRGGWMEEMTRASFSNIHFMNFIVEGEIRDMNSSRISMHDSQPLLCADDSVGRIHIFHVSSTNDKNENGIEIHGQYLMPPHRSVTFSSILSIDWHPSSNRAPCACVLRMPCLENDNQLWFYTIGIDSETDSSIMIRQVENNPRLTFNYAAWPSNTQCHSKLAIACLNRKTPLALWHEERNWIEPISLNSNSDGLVCSWMGDLNQTGKFSECVALGCRNGLISIVDIRSSKQIFQLKMDAAITDIQPMRDSEWRLGAFCMGGCVQFWDLRSNKIPQSGSNGVVSWNTNNTHKNILSTQDETGRYLLCGDMNSTIHIWDSIGLCHISEWKTHMEPQSTIHQIGRMCGFTPTRQKGLDAFFFTGKSLGALWIG